MGSPVQGFFAAAVCRGPADARDSGHLAGRVNSGVAVIAALLAMGVAYADGGLPPAGPNSSLGVAAYRFWGLEHLPGGSGISYAYAISATGDVVVGESFSPIAKVHGEGAVWRRSSPQSWQVSAMGLPADDALNSPAAGVSSNGRWVVGRASFGPPTAPTLDTDAYRWSPASGFRRLGAPEGFALVAATGSSDGGDVVVGYGGPIAGYVDLRALAWIRHGADWVVRLLEVSRHSEAIRIDASGRSAVGWVRSETAEAANGANGREAALWTTDDPQHVNLTLLGASTGSDFFSMPLGLERLRSTTIVFGFSGSGEPMLPVVWTVAPGAPVRLAELPLPPGLTSGAVAGMSRDGRRFVGNCWGEPGGAFEISVCVWDDGAVWKLGERLAAAGVTAAQDWVLWGVAGISEDGKVICGSGTDPAGDDRPWVAEIR